MRRREEERKNRTARNSEDIVGASNETGPQLEIEGAGIDADRMEPTIPSVL